MEGGIRDDGIVDGGSGVDGGDPPDDDEPDGIEHPSEGEADDVADLVRAAAADDEAAWATLVRRLNGIPWAIARSYGLSEGDAGDVNAVTWLRLVEHIKRLRDPSRVAAWLAVTARRECFRLLRHRGRQIPRGGPAEIAEIGDADRRSDLEVDAGLLAKELLDAFHRAVAQISERCQKLLAMLQEDPPPSYETIGSTLGMPMGAIGPTRRRCLEKLRKKLEEGGITEA